MVVVCVCGGVDFGVMLVEVFVECLQEDLCLFK